MEFDDNSKKFMPFKIKDGQPESDAISIPVDAETCRLFVKMKKDDKSGKTEESEEREYEFLLKLNELQAIDFSAGIQGRLHNLGYYRGEIDGDIDSLTKEAAKNFQESYDLKTDGIPGSKTRKKLKEIYGC